MSFGVALRNGVAFALGTVPSMTSGSGRIPSLNLNFLGNTLDPGVTFSRGTQATRFASDGTLQYAPHNLLTYSRQFDNAAWTKSNSFVQTNQVLYSQQFENAAWSQTNASVSANVTAAPDGTITADRITTTTAGGFIAQSVGAFSSQTGTVSLYLKSTGADNGAYIELYDGTGPSYAGSLNIPSLSTGGTDAGNGWRRYSFTFVGFTIGNPLEIWIYPAKNGTGSGSVYAWGAQVVRGSVAGDYVATTSAALPVLYLSWDGSVTARKLCEDTSTGVHSIQETPAITSGATYTFSAYVKAGERTWAVVQLHTAIWAYVNLSTGAVGTTSGSPTVTVTSIANGFWRITVRSAVVSATASNFIYPAASDGGVSYAGDGSSGIYIADAQLALGPYPLDYTLTTTAAVYGPRMDYDPSTLATQNLLTYSNAFSNVVWGAADATHVISANSVVGPDGSVTGSVWTFPASSSAFGYNTQIITSTSANLALTFSVWARVQSGTKNIKLRISNVTIATVSSADIALTTTWQRISYSIAAGTLASTSQIGVGFYLAASNSLVAGDLVELYGAQLNIGSTALPYIATTTTAISNYTPRGLFVEEQRTNLLLQSNDFQTSWTPTNITRTLNSTTSPEGIVNAVKIEATAGVATTLFQAAVVNATAATGSVFVKQGTSATVANTFQLRNATTLTVLVAGTLNYSTGVFTYTTGSTGVVVTDTGNGYWRIAVSASAGITAGNSVEWYVGWAGAVATAGQFLYAYGAQLEAGAFATSYIPTLASQLTRNADVASVNTLTPWFSNDNGTLYFEGVTNAPVTLDVRNAVSINDGTLTNTHRLFSYNGKIGGSTVVGGVNQADLQTFTYTTGAVFKSVYAYAVNDFAMTANGLAPLTDGAGTLPSGLTKLNIGGSGIPWGFWVRAVQYYPRRLPNTQLQSLTA